MSKVEILNKDRVKTILLAQFSNIWFEGNQSKIDGISSFCPILRIFFPELHEGFCLRFRSLNDELHLKTVPPFASSKIFFFYESPSKEPFSCPKSSDSSQSHF